jgi:hypothetical protein
MIVRNAETIDVALHSAPWWRWALVSIVLVSLVLTLATRTFHTTLSYNTTIHAGATQAIRQHLDRDAVRWAAPVANITVSEIPAFYPRVTTSGIVLPSLLLEESLFNRPPPSR